MSTDTPDEYEYAMLKHPDGRPVARPQALASLRKFQEAVRLAGGRAPAGMAWSEERGWHPAPARVEGDTGADDRAAALERLERPLLARRAIQQRRERADAARRMRAAVELYARASDAALEYFRRFALGGYMSPHPNFHEMVGQQLAVAFPDGRAPHEAREARQARLARVSR
jgi:hypothetical protein